MIIKSLFKTNILFLKIHLWIGGIYRKMDGGLLGSGGGSWMDGGWVCGHVVGGLLGSTG